MYVRTQKRSVPYNDECNMMRKNEGILQRENDEHHLFLCLILLKQGGRKTSTKQHLRALACERISYPYRLDYQVCYSLYTASMYLFYSLSPHVSSESSQMHTKRLEKRRKRHPKASNPTEFHIHNNTVAIYTLLLLRAFDSLFLSKYSAVRQRNWNENDTFHNVQAIAGMTERDFTKQLKSHL